MAQAKQCRTRSTARCSSLSAAACQGVLTQDAYHLAGLYLVEGVEDPGCGLHEQGQMLLVHPAGRGLQQA